MLHWFRHTSKWPKHVSVQPHSLMPAVRNEILNRVIINSIWTTTQKTENKATNKITVSPQFVWTTTSLSQHLELFTVRSTTSCQSLESRWNRGGGMSTHQQLVKHIRHIRSNFFAVIESDLSTNSWNFVFVYWQTGIVNKYSVECGLLSFGETYLWTVLWFWRLYSVGCGLFCFGEMYLWTVLCFWRFIGLIGFQNVITRVCWIIWPRK